MDWITFLLSTPHNDPQLPLAWDADIPGRTLSWNQYVHAVKSVAAGLQATRLEFQGCVALLSENDIYYYALGDAVIAAGGIFCPMQTSRRIAELAHQLKTASVKYLFASPKLLDLALEAARSAGIPDVAIFVYDPPGVEVYRGSRICMSRLMSRDDTQWKNPNVGKDPRAIMAYRMFSSGTTGSPKAAEISHYTHIARVDQRSKGPLSDPTDKARALIWTPIYHSTCQWNYHQAAIGEQTMYVTSDKEVKDVPALIDIIRQYDITATQVPPYFLLPVVACIKNGTRSTGDLSTLIKVSSGGSTIDPHAAHQFRAVFPEIKFLGGYGTTEAGGFALGPGPDISSPGVIGNVFPDVELKFVNPETLVEARDGEDGEVCVRSVQVFSGYHNNPEANTSSFLTDPSGNWFRTGDKGHLDPKTRHLVLTGRYKEIFKIDLKQVAPEEIENVIMQHEAIEDAAVLPVPAKHDQTQVEVKAYVVKKDVTKQVSAEDIIAFVATKLSSHKVPRGGVVFCNEIPRNALKKVVRRKLREIDACEG
ncbi:hypothetical protein CBER1_11789 [Cercospora berteroae]|uniref:AMP-dependent synthetase/ligase domain-containing protein n=1 Tax=Cercospora berteroae TaxID=357750 RepID=A0A2S6C0F8_9PEZI|nr:hypothetical protein CBER1_11789 [Cercospora berteroae]